MKHQGVVLDPKFMEHFRAFEGIKSFLSSRFSLVMSFGAFKPCLRSILSLRSRSEVATSDPCLFGLESRKVSAIGWSLEPLCLKP